MRKTFLYKNSMLIYAGLMTTIMTLPTVTTINQIIRTRSFYYNDGIIFFLFAVFFIGMITNFQYIDIYPDKIEFRMLNKVDNSFAFTEYYVKTTSKLTEKKKKLTTLSIMRKSTKGRVFHTELDMSKKRLTEFLAVCEMIKK